MLKEETEKSIMAERHRADKEVLQLEHENSIREMVEIQVGVVLSSLYMYTHCLILHVCNSTHKIL